MSIYATLWKLKFPIEGDRYERSDWIEVTAQAVPPHVGTPTPGLGYEGGDPFADFLPPPVETRMHGQPPSEAEIQRYFQVTPPTVHQMVLRLESKGLIARTPGKARSIRLLIDRSDLPDLA